MVSRRVMGIDVKKVIETLRSKRISDRCIAEITQELTDATVNRVRHRLRILRHHELWGNVGLNGSMAQVLQLPTTSGGEMPWVCARISALVAHMV